jgi:RNA polymerase sigma-70 factor (ECF subfamily)
MPAPAVDFTDDVALVAALRAGEDAAFAWLLDRYGAALQRVARTFVSTPGSADEVVQDTWLAVITGIDRFEGRSTLKTWIFRILMNQARTRGVKDHRSVPFGDLADDDGAGPAFAPDRFRAGLSVWSGHWIFPPAPWEEEPGARLQSAETLEVIRRAIAELPERQRAVLVLRDVDGWAAAEVCDLLELSEANQRVLLHRARAGVRQALEDDFVRRTA